ncbi:YitT family protein [Anaerolentibacter hominis]|uniref:YitT family protein n=1 Tax=Anaerolentibacter hominis TaxID=3079009 RepID=UPI0031B82860
MLKNSKAWKRMIIIILGTSIMAAAINLVFEPMNMVTGGFSGLAILVKRWTEGLLPGGVPLWLTNFSLNIPLFLVANKVLGKQYIGYTLFANLSFTAALYLIPSYDVARGDFLLAAVFGGVLTGIGLGLVLMLGSSTGGTDLLGALLHKRFQYYSVAQFLMVIDGGIVLLGAAVFGINNALYAVIAVFISTKIADSLMEGLKFAKAAYVISDKYEQIAERIMEELGRGVTGISMRGMYSNAEKQMLLCVVGKKEIVRLTELARECDKTAFIIVSDVREVMGEGFGLEIEENTDKK